MSHMLRRSRHAFHAPLLMLLLSVGCSDPETSSNNSMSSPDEGTLDQGMSDDGNSPEDEGMDLAPPTDMGEGSEDLGELPDGMDPVDMTDMSVDPADMMTNDMMEADMMATPTCQDGIQNGGEEGVDCGGSCAPCLSYLPAFPGALGPAGQTPGGRGGDIHVVDTLADSGAGSLRECVEASGPRTCVFEVSGEIRLDRRLLVDEPFLTIAGHTAPSPGITVRDETFSIQTHDVVVQHLRVRLGLGAGSDTDTMTVTANSAGTDVHGVIIDHCSLSWGTDGTLDFWKRDGTIKDVTVSNTIMSETLQPHSLALLFNEANNAANNPFEGVVVARNLLAHNAGRNPRITSPGEFVVYNNVVYNWSYTAMQLDDDKTNRGGFKASVVGNVMVSGLDRKNAGRSPIHYTVTQTPAEAYFEDNVTEPAMSDVVDVDVGTGVLVSMSSPLDLTPYAILASADVKADVLADVGARPADRDAVDQRIVQDVQNGTGQQIEDEADVGGFPTLDENTRSLTLPADPSADDDGDGYTNLEEWLHGFYAQVE